MNIHEALLYLNFANTLDTNGFNSKELIDFTEEANTVINNTQLALLPVGVLHFIKGKTGATRTLHHYVIGNQCISLEGETREIYKMKNIIEHIIGEVYINDSDIYISSRGPSENEQRTVTVLNNVQLSIDEPVTYKY